MPPVIFSPLVKWVLATIGGAAVVHWAVKEIRRINADMDRIRSASAVDMAARRDLPTLRRDPISGEWRVTES